MKVRGFLVPFFLVLAAMIFSSCVEVVQVITLEKNVYKIDYRVMLNKNVLALADTSADEVFDEMGLDTLPDNMKVEKIDTELECGAVLSTEIDSSAKNEYADFLPTIKGGKVEIPLPFTDGFDDTVSDMKKDDSNMQAVYDMFCSTAKWRIMVSKKIVPTARKVWLESKYGAKNLEFFYAGEILCINIPMTYLTGSELKVVIEK